MILTAHLYSPDGYSGLRVDATVTRRRNGPKIMVGVREMFDLKHPEALVSITRFQVQTRLPEDPVDRRRGYAALDKVIRETWSMTLPPAAVALDDVEGPRTHSDNFDEVQ